MEEIKTRFVTFVTDKLSTAPDGTAKADLIEELSENLYQRWLDMTAAGMNEDEAWQKAAEDLGDTAELVDYLKSLQPDEPLPQMVLDPEKEDGGQLEDMMKNVEVIIRSAMSQAKNAIHEAKEQLNDSGVFHWNWKSDDGKVEVSVDAPEVSDVSISVEEPDLAEDDAHFNGINLDAVTKKLDDAAKKISDAFKDKPFTIGVDVDDTGCSIGVNPHKKAEKDIIYGVGYDKDKGGFFAQWGEYKGNYSRPVEDGPVCSEALRGIDVQTVSGDVTIRMTEHSEDDVIIDGDVDELDVRRSDDGVLTITQGKTASSTFFFGRGLSSASVILYLPRRHWDFLKVCTISGDVRVDGDNELGLLAVKTTSGDLEGGLPRCGQLDFSSISGDLNWKGDVQTLRAKTTSGDLQLSGYLGETQIASISGDVDLNGAVTGLRCTTTSGDINVRSSVQPEKLDVSSRSGDCTAYLPDRSPFTVHFRTASGDLISDFFGGPMSGREITLSYNGEGGPIYELNTTSGDVRLKKI